MEKTYVLFSNSVGAPEAKITFDHRELYSGLQPENEAVNDNNARYAHYYRELLNEYDVLEWHYVTTKNA